MKLLLVAEYRDGKVLGCTSELIAFAGVTGAEHVMFLFVGTETELPPYGGKLYLAESSKYGEYNQRSTNNCCSMLSIRKNQIWSFSVIPVTAGIWPRG